MATLPRPNAAHVAPQKEAEVGVHGAHRRRSGPAAVRGPGSPVFALRGYGRARRLRGEPTRVRRGKAVGPQALRPAGNVTGEGILSTYLFRAGLREIVLRHVTSPCRAWYKGVRTAGDTAVLAGDERADRSRARRK